MPVSLGPYNQDYAEVNNRKHKRKEKPGRFFFALVLLIALILTLVSSC